MKTIRLKLSDESRRVIELGMIAIVTATAMCLLCGCSTVAHALGASSPDDLEQKLAPVNAAITAAGAAFGPAGVGVSGALVALSTIGLNLWRNQTRKKVLGKQA